MPMPFETLAPGAVLPDAELQCRRLAELIRPQLRPDTAIVGILSGGAWIAERLADLLGIADRGTINVSFYRDDFEKIGLHPNVQPTDLPFAVDDRTLLIVDDVLHTGRTTRAAINVLFDFGRPARVELAVLAERPGRHLPFAADYCAWRVHPADTTMLTLRRDKAGHLSWQLETTESGHA